MSPKMPPRFSFNTDLTSSVNAPLEKYRRKIYSTLEVRLWTVYVNAGDQVGGGGAGFLAKFGHMY